MNASVNPCDNFWEFACGGWRKKLPIPDDKSQIWVFGPMEDRMDDQIRELLAAYKVDVDGKKNSRAVTLAASTYQKCMKLKDNNEEGLKYMKELVNDAVGEWTIGQKEVSTKTLPKWQQTLVQAMVKGNVFPVFTFGLYPDSTNTSVNDLYVIYNILHKQKQNINLFFIIVFTISIRLRRPSVKKPLSKCRYSERLQGVHEKFSQFILWQQLPKP